MCLDPISVTFIFLKWSHVSRPTAIFDFRASNIIPLSCAKFRNVSHCGNPRRESNIETKFNSTWTPFPSIKDAFIILPFYIYLFIYFIFCFVVLFCFVYYSPHPRKPGCESGKTWRTCCDDQVLFMAFVREFLSSGPWSNATALITSAVDRIGEMADTFDVWNSDNWQIRLSCVLLLWTFLNLICIGLAWKIYGQTLSHVFYNKPKTTVPQGKRQFAPNLFSSSIDDLREKKIQ